MNKFGERFKLEDQLDGQLRDQLWSQLKGELTLAVNL